MHVTEHVTRLSECIVKRNQVRNQFSILTEYEKISDAYNLQGVHSVAYEVDVSFIAVDIGMPTSLPRAEMTKSLRTVPSSSSTLRTNSINQTTFLKRRLTSNTSVSTSTLISRRMAPASRLQGLSVRGLSVLPW
uniref:ARAD1D25916p n=1 Tax=Blastobotrys adeninivorans TaxID=409370 RepID=A0A060TAC2_BLAAD